MIAVQERDVDLEPVPRQIAPQKPVTIAGRLRASFHDPELVVTAPDGSVRELAVRAAGARAAASRGPSAATPAPGATRSRSPPTARAARACSPTSRSTAVWRRRATRRCPRACCRRRPPRRRPRRASWRWSTAIAPPRACRRWRIDARLAEAARAHSRDMADHDFVAHISPTTGSARRAGGAGRAHARSAARERRPRLLGRGRRERLHGQPRPPRQHPGSARAIHRHRRRRGPRAGRLGPAVRHPAHDVTRSRHGGSVTKV